MSDAAGSGAVRGEEAQREGRAISLRRCGPGVLWPRTWGALGLDVQKTGRSSPGGCSAGHAEREGFVILDLSESKQKLCAIVYTEF